MGKTYGVMDRIRKIERNAVGVEGRKNHAGLISDETVDVEPVERTSYSAARVFLPDPQNIGCVGLVRAHDIFRDEADGIGKEPEVLYYI